MYASGYRRESERHIRHGREDDLSPYLFVQRVPTCVTKHYVWQKKTARGYVQCSCQPTRVWQRRRTRRVRRRCQTWVGWQFICTVRSPALFLLHARFCHTSMHPLTLPCCSEPASDDCCWQITANVEERAVTAQSTDETGRFRKYLCADSHSSWLLKPLYSLVCLYQEPLSPTQDKNSYALCSMMAAYVNCYRLNCIVIN